MISYISLHGMQPFIVSWTILDRGVLASQKRHWVVLPEGRKMTSEAYEGAEYLNTTTQAAHSSTNYGSHVQLCPSFLTLSGPPISVRYSVMLSPASCGHRKQSWVSRIEFDQEGEYYHRSRIDSMIKGRAYTSFSSKED